MKFKYKHKVFDMEGVSQEDHIYRNIIKHRSFYEIDLLQYMHLINNHRKKKNTIAIDVGANIGNHSIFFQSFLTDYVISVEPNPNVLPILEKNLNQNISNYAIYGSALGETEGVGNIVLPDVGTNNMGMTKIKIYPDSKDSTIRIITLDSMVDDWRQKHNIGDKVSIAIIKIDVEGMELAVLKGAKNTIKTNKPDLYIEAATVEKFEELNNFLGSLGYKMLSRWAATPVYHFSYNPSKSLLFAVCLARIYRVIRKYYCYRKLWFKLM